MRRIFWICIVLPLRNFNELGVWSLGMFADLIQDGRNIGMREGTPAAIFDRSGSTSVANFGDREDSDASRWPTRSAARGG